MTKPAVIQFVCLLLCFSYQLLLFSLMLVCGSTCQEVGCRSVLAAGGGLPMAVFARAHLYAVPALRLQFDVWYSEDRRHCRRNQMQGE